MQDPSHLQGESNASMNIVEKKKGVKRSTFNLYMDPIQEID